MSAARAFETPLTITDDARIAVMGLCGVLHTGTSLYLNRFSSMFLSIEIIEGNSVVEIPVVCGELCKMAH